MRVVRQRPRLPRKAMDAHPWNAGRVCEQWGQGNAAVAGGSAAEVLGAAAGEQCRPRRVSGPRSRCRSRAPGRALQAGPCKPGWARHRAGLSSAAAPELSPDWTSRQPCPGACGQYRFQAGFWPFRELPGRWAAQEEADKSCVLFLCIFCVLSVNTSGCLRETQAQIMPSAPSPSGWTEFQAVGLDKWPFPHLM